ncbi:ribonucleoside-diphosphate reductase subunit alpha [Candidatus Parcubacteria bacterium]|nr:MAG: ribonucleoside-diphosphate reductase subunit alpha [Candidatus Parcubacteria bacterium]
MKNMRQPFAWLNKNSCKFLSREYLSEGVTPEERILAVAKHAENLLNKDGFADKFYDYMGKGYYSLSTPVWANFGLKKGLPISCFSSHICDDMPDILYTVAEAGMFSKFGGGTAGYIGDVRGRGKEITDNGVSSGAVHFLQLFETLVNVVSQGSTRRGHFSPYLPIEHSDIEEFLEIGTEGNPIQKLTHGVTVTDKWMQEMIDGDSKKRSIWAKLLQSRVEVGYPYVFWNDNVNQNTVDVYKDKNIPIRHSNMCSEIMLPTNEDWSFVCCLSSMNLLYYDEWKDTDAVETLVYFLDSVMEEFIQRLESMRDSPQRDKQMAFHFMRKAYKFAVDNRALGLGVLGWHSYLQSKMIPFESKEAKTENVKIFKLIQERSYAASKQLAVEYGEPPLLKGYGRRNSTLNAVAPTTSSSFILGQVSQGIEPFLSNCCVQDLAKMKITFKNPFLKDLLEEKGQNTKEVWDSIRNKDGSVQHLSFLSDHEKDVFKTFSEIDQIAIIDQAASRQQYIDQGQSLNLMINPKMPTKDINALYIFAWKSGIKTLYYQHSTNAAQQFSQSKMCIGSCEA